MGAWFVVILLPHDPGFFLSFPALKICLYSYEYCLMGWLRPDYLLICYYFVLYLYNQ